MGYNNIRPGYKFFSPPPLGEVPDQIVSQDKSQFTLRPVTIIDINKGINSIGNPFPPDFTVIDG
jgi:hypothetical protein